MTYKNIEQQRATTKERVRRYRDKQKGVTEVEGVTALEPKGVTIVIKKQGRTQGMSQYPDIIDKLTDPTWRGKLEKICAAFKASSNPHYSHDVWLGDTNLATVCGYLECTR